MNKSRKERFVLINKIINNELQELSKRIADVNALVQKKEETVATFKQYVLDYQAQLQEKPSMDTAQFTNYQAFLDQLSRVLAKERGELLALVEKKDVLVSDYQEKKYRKDKIEEYIKTLEQ